VNTLDDDATLHAMGYPRKLTRRFKAFDNFAISFTIINVLSGIFSSFGFGMNAGGPRVLVFGWLGVSVMVLFVGAAMAEVASAYPTSGALYFSAGKLAKRHKGAWSWFTGWLNFAGQIAGTAATDFAAASFINILIGLEWSSYNPTKYTTLLVFGVILLVHALANTYTVKLVGLLNRISVWWLLVGALVIVGVLVFKPAHHQSASFVFTHFVNTTGWHSSLYVGLLGLLLAQYTFTGYDASAHMTEETHDAAKAGPRGIVMSIVVSLIAGWILLVGITFAIQNYDGEAGSATGVPPAQIFIDALGATGGKLLLLIVIGAQFFCGMSSVTANSRMIYAFSRDGALPGSRVWHRINKRTKTPTNAVWLAAAGAFLLGLPYLWNATAYAAVTSIAVIGLYIAYVLPVFLRLLQGSGFQRGPWHLGRWSRPIGVIAVGWTVVISILFMLPTTSPVTATSFNYTPIAVLLVLGFAGIWWLVSARRWFTGPKVQGTPEELAAIEHELEF
jgi:amino acid permease (GABA permease)